MATRPSFNIGKKGEYHERQMCLRACGMVSCAFLGQTHDDEGANGGTRVPGGCAQGRRGDQQSRPVPM